MFTVLALTRTSQPRGHPRGRILNFYDLWPVITKAVITIRIQTFLSISFFLDQLSKWQRHSFSLNSTDTLRAVWDPTQGAPKIGLSLCSSRSGMPAAPHLHQDLRFIRVFVCLLFVLVRL